MITLCIDCAWKLKMDFRKSKKVGFKPCDKCKDHKEAYLWIR